MFRNVKIRGKKTNIYTSSSDQMVYHRVKSGDTLGKLARMYGTTVNQLCRLNGLKSTSTLRIGQSIRCSAGIEPDTKPAAQKATKAAAPTAVAAQRTITVKADASASSALGKDENRLANDTAGEKGIIYHRIQSGDTQGALARRYGTTGQKLCELNGISKTTVLQLGRSLRCS